LFFNGIEFDFRLVFRRFIPIAPPEHLFKTVRGEFAPVPRPEFVANHSQIVHRKIFQKLFGEQSILKFVHIADRKSDRAVGVALGVEFFEIFTLELIQYRRRIIDVRPIPVAFFKVFLQPRFVVETLAVNRFDFSNQDAPIRSGSGVNFLVGNFPRLPEPQIARLHAVVPFGFRETIRVEIIAFDFG